MIKTSTSVCMNKNAIGCGPSDESFPAKDKHK
jgi:hypothetical protein